MSEALKRIEKKHKGYEWCHECDQKRPCDVVKLAQALDMIRISHAPSGPRQRCLRCGLDGNCCGEYLLAERVLREVAGE